MHAFHYKHFQSVHCSTDRPAVFLLILRGIKARIRRLGNCLNPNGPNVTCGPPIIFFRYGQEVSAGSEYPPLGQLRNPRCRSVDRAGA